MKKYKLKTLRDVIDQIPADKIETCMAEIAKGMVLMLAAKDVMDALGSEHGLSAEESAVIGDEWAWTDDGKSEVTLGAEITHKGETIAQIREFLKFGVKDEAAGG